MDPATIMGLGSAALGGLQAGISAIGMGKARKKAFKAIEDIPTYTEDPETKAMLAMRKARLGAGLSAEAKKIAQQGIGTAAAAATKGALSMGKGAGLSAIGAIQRQSARQAQQLGLQEEQAQERRRMAYERAVGEAGAERRRAFASEQEKKQLEANIRLEQLAAKRAAVQQGIRGITSGLTSAAMSGMYGQDEEKRVTPEVIQSVPAMQMVGPVSSTRKVPGVSKYSTAGLTTLQKGRK